MRWRATSRAGPRRESRAAGRSARRPCRRRRRSSSSSSSCETSRPISTLPKKRKPGFAAVFSKARETALMFSWSGATPRRTRPHGVGRRSIRSTSTTGSSLFSKRIGRVEAGRAGADDGDAQRRRAHGAIVVADAQWAQVPQPAAASGASPSATWKLEPHPHAEATFGLSILKPGLLQRLEEVDRRALQVRRAERVDDDLDAVELELVVALLGAAVEPERVLEPAATAALDRDAQHLGLARGLLRHDPGDLRRGALGERDEGGLLLFDGGHDQSVAEGSLRRELRDTCNALGSTDCGSVRSVPNDGASVTARTS